MSLTPKADPILDHDLFSKHDFYKSQPFSGFQAYRPGLCRRGPLVLAVRSPQKIELPAVGNVLIAGSISLFFLDGADQISLSPILSDSSTLDPALWPLGIGAGDLGPAVLPSMANLIQILFCQMHPQFYKEAGQPERDSNRLYSLQYFYEGCQDSLYAGEARL